MVKIDTLAESYVNVADQFLEYLANNEEMIKQFFDLNLIKNPFAGHPEPISLEYPLKYANREYGSLEIIISSYLEETDFGATSLGESKYDKETRKGVIKINPTALLLDFMLYGHKRNGKEKSSFLELIIPTLYHEMSHDYLRRKGVIVERENINTIEDHFREELKPYIIHESLANFVSLWEEKYWPTELYSNVYLENLESTAKTIADIIKENYERRKLISLSILYGNASNSSLSRMMNKANLYEECIENSKKIVKTLEREIPENYRNKIGLSKRLMIIGEVLENL